MRKTWIIALVLLVVLAFGASAQTLGVGGAFSIDALGGLPSSAMLSLKLPSIPFLWGIGAQIGQDTFQLAFTADWWLYQTNLVGFLNLYIGPGLYLAVPQPFEIGGRVPIGLNAYPLEVLELFIEIAPTLVFFSSDGVRIPTFGLQGAFGFRFWFNI